MSYADDRYWGVYNGEIYNYVELRTELKKYGYTFKTACDTEVLLAAFAKWGPATIRVRAMRGYPGRSRRR